MSTPPITPLFDVELDDAVRAFIDGLGDDAQCFCDDGPATHIVRHGTCSLTACTKHAMESEWNKRLAIVEGVNMYCPTCPGSKFAPTDLHINPA